MRRNLYFVSGVLLAFVALLLTRGSAKAAEPADFFGRWEVTTKLVTAYDAVNPNYRPGDIRVDVWTITGDVAGCSLTTKDGSMPGVVQGTAAVFDVAVPLDGIIVMKVHIEAYLTSSGSMKGTINADYWDSRFGYKVGLDAWTFEGVKR
ncbi:MAG: hypothetical protein U1F43_06555 [Myxococcota bacterium]